MVQEGYDKVRIVLHPQAISDGYRQISLLQYKGSPFRVANLHHWLVVVSGPKYIEELKKANNDELSLIASGVEVCIDCFI